MSADGIVVAVLARANCDSGNFRLQAEKLASLYLEKGLFEIGQGEIGRSIAHDQQEQRLDRFRPESSVGSKDRLQDIGEGHCHNGSINDA